MCFIALTYDTESKSIPARMLVEAAGDAHFSRIIFTYGETEHDEKAIEMEMDNVYILLMRKE